MQLAKLQGQRDAVASDVAKRAQAFVEAQADERALAERLEERKDCAGEDDDDRENVYMKAEDGSPPATVPLSKQCWDQFKLCTSPLMQDLLRNCALSLEVKAELALSQDMSQAMSQGLPATATQADLDKDICGMTATHAAYVALSEAIAEARLAEDPAEQQARIEAAVLLHISHSARPGKGSGKACVVARKPEPYDKS